MSSPMELERGCSDEWSVCRTEVKWATDSKSKYPLVHLPHTKIEILPFPCIVKMLTTQLRKMLAPVTYHIEAELYCALQCFVLLGLLGKCLPGMLQAQWGVPAMLWADVNAHLVRFMQTKIYVTADSGMLHLLMNPSERQGSGLVLYECSHTAFESAPAWAQLPWRPGANTHYGYSPKGTMGHL